MHLQLNYKQSKQMRHWTRTHLHEFTLERGGNGIGNGNGNGNGCESGQLALCKLSAAAELKTRGPSLSSCTSFSSLGNQINRSPETRVLCMCVPVHLSALGWLLHHFRRRLFRLCKYSFNEDISFVEWSLVLSSNI